MRFFGYATGTGEIAPLPGGIAMYSGLEYGVFNIAMLEGRISHAGLTLEQRLFEIGQYFKPKTARWSLWLCDDLLDYATRRRSRQALADFGLRAISHPPGMIASTLLPPTGSLPPVDVQPVSDKSVAKCVQPKLPRSASKFRSLSRRRFYAQDHAWHGRLLRLRRPGGRPRGVDLRRRCRSGRVGSLLVGYLHPSYRRLGYGEATMRAALAEMQRRTGLDRIVLQSTEAGYALYRRMGFRDATRFSVYLTK